MLQIKEVIYKFDPNKNYPTFDEIMNFGECYIRETLKINKIDNLTLYKKSLDNRHGNFRLVLSFLFSTLSEEYLTLSKNNVSIYNKDETINNSLKEKYNLKDIVIVGSGPAGLFSALLFSMCKFRVSIIEMGKRVEDRILDVEDFFNNNHLNETSNICFGEGGAGTFSDGKLYTGSNNSYNRFILEKLVEFGAPSDILYESHPHVGSDILRKVLVNIRIYLESIGTKYYFETKLISFSNNYAYFDSKIIDKLHYDYLILATGHSSYDTYEYLNSIHMDMEPKNFAVGLRIEHPQKDVDKANYHGNYKLLPPSIYKQVVHLDNNRSVYTFCMCPGGEVVNSSSINGRLVVNGMSNRLRNNVNANSAILCDVRVEDYYKNSVLDGLFFIKELETTAYNKENGKVLVQTLYDYLNNINTNKLKSIIPSIRSEYKVSNLNDILPSFINESLKEGIIKISSKLSFFKNTDAILTAIETRTSSPIRISRNDLLETSIKGVYAVGEGSGHSGGIVTSATDAIKVTLKILEGEKYE